eukprot:CAMPEP_0114553074 /NCGR_PEP_ID=MMETSP0114-20121206/7461_1 /TAXON_ID=31324 /ORGANISM="Goniomonas sp, Strain m" /LENGTH=832 /DNA_ID=CAMNT_0001737987 /DNA_START=392 /DNA_END=2890 /DNA_ORIENTATION=-
MAETQSSKVRIVGVSRTALVSVLGYLYTGTVEIEPNLQVAADLLIAADRFDLHKLKLSCAATLETVLQDGLQHAAEIYNLGRTYYCPSLQRAALIKLLLTVDQAAHKGGSHLSLEDMKKMYEHHRAVSFWSTAVNCFQDRQVRVDLSENSTWLQTVVEVLAMANEHCEEAASQTVPNYLTAHRALALKAATAVYDTVLKSPPDDGPSKPPDSPQPRLPDVKDRRPEKRPRLSSTPPNSPKHGPQAMQAQSRSTEAPTSPPSASAIPAAPAAATFPALPHPRRRRSARQSAVPSVGGSSPPLTPIRAFRTTSVLYDVCGGQHSTAPGAIAGSADPPEFLRRVVSSAGYGLVTSGAIDVLQMAGTRFVRQLMVAVSVLTQARVQDAVSAACAEYVLPVVPMPNAVDNAELAERPVVLAELRVPTYDDLHTVPRAGNHVNPITHLTHRLHHGLFTVLQQIRPAGITNAALTCVSSLLQLFVEKIAARAGFIMRRGTYRRVSSAMIVGSLSVELPSSSRLTTNVMAMATKALENVAQAVPPRSNSTSRSRLQLPVGVVYKMLHMFWDTTPNSAVALTAAIQSISGHIFSYILQSVDSEAGFIITKRSVAVALQSDVDLQSVCRLVGYGVMPVRAPFSGTVPDGAGAAAGSVQLPQDLQHFVSAHQGDGNRYVEIKDLMTLCMSDTARSVLVRLTNLKLHVVCSCVESYLVSLARAAARVAGVAPGGVGAPWIAEEHLLFALQEVEGPVVSALKLSQAGPDTDDDGDGPDLSAGAMAAAAARADALFGAFPGDPAAIVGQDGGGDVGDNTMDDGDDEQGVDWGDNGEGEDEEDEDEF